jgi:hypothetical protein
VSDIAVSREGLDIGGVLRTTVEVTRRNIGPMLLLSALFASLPVLLVDLATALSQAQVQSVSLFARLVSYLTGVLLKGALIHLTLADLDGRRATWTEAMSAGLNTFRGLFGISFIAGAGVFVGTILLVVPGVMLGVMWCVAAPVLVAERRSLSPAFTRSAALTKGHRWKVFALLLAFGTSLVLLVLVVMALLAGLFSIFTDMRGGVLLGGIISSLILGLANGPIFAVLYTELRRLKEGAAQIAAVFD